MISLLLSTLRLSGRWGLFWLRSRATIWLISLARYNLQSLLRAR